MIAPQLGINRTQLRQTLISAVGAISLEEGLANQRRAEERRAESRAKREREAKDARAAMIVAKAQLTATNDEAFAVTPPVMMPTHEIVDPRTAARLAEAHHAMEMAAYRRLEAEKARDTLLAQREESYPSLNQFVAWAVAAGFNYLKDAGRNAIYVCEGVKLFVNGAAVGTTSSTSTHQRKARGSELLTAEEMEIRRIANAESAAIAKAKRLAAKAQKVQSGKKNKKDKADGKRATK